MDELESYQKGLGEYTLYIRLDELFALLRNKVCRDTFYAH